MKRDYKFLLQEGLKAQVEKLRENDHKCGFDVESINILFKKLQAEVYELQDELQVQPKLYDLKAIRQEAADVANFAFMIILKCVQLMRQKRK